MKKGKYDRLHAYLRRQKAVEVEMSFTEIECMIRALLPNSAQRLGWWADEPAPEEVAPQKLAWKLAGFRAALIAGRDRVRFTRPG